MILAIRVLDSDLAEIQLIFYDDPTKSFGPKMDQFCSWSKLGDRFWYFLLSCERHLKMD